MKFFYIYIAIFFNFQQTSSHFHPLQVENCDSNWRLVVEEDDNNKFRLERVKEHTFVIIEHLWSFTFSYTFSPRLNGIVNMLVFE